MNLNQKNTRPELLSAFCILSFIGSGFAFFTYFLVSLFFNRFSALIIKYSSWHSTDAISPLYFTLLMFLFGVSLAAVIKIWKGYRSGLFIYIPTQLLILFMPVIWINWNAFSTTNAIFTTVFIFGYSWHWRWLK